MGPLLLAIALTAARDPWARAPAGLVVRVLNHCWCATLICNRVDQRYLTHVREAALHAQAGGVVVLECSAWSAHCKVNSVTLQSDTPPQPVGPLHVP